MFNTSHVEQSEEASVSCT